MDIAETMEFGVQTEISIFDLSTAPQFIDDVADRIFQAWCRGSGLQKGDIVSRLHEITASGEPTFSLVAHAAEVFVGTASVIPSDMDERPDLSPWLAALWVEERFRKVGIGSRMVEAASNRSFNSGIETLYLCARATLQSVYQNLGRTIIEKGVGRDELTIFVLPNQR